MSDWLVSVDQWSVNDLLLVSVWIVGIAAGFGAWIYTWGMEWIELRDERRKKR